MDSRPTQRAQNASALGVSVESALDASANAVVAVDRRGRIVFASALVQETFGWPPADLVGEQVEVLVPEGLVEAHVAHRDDFSRAPRKRPMGSDMEFVARRRDGTEFHAEVSLAPLRSRRGPLVLATVADTTTRIDLRGQLQQAYEELQIHAEEVERQGRETARLVELTELLGSCQSLDEAYEVIAGAADRLFEGDEGAMYVLDPARTTVEMVASWGRQAPSQHSFTPGDCWALRRGRLHVVDGADAELICPHVDSPVSVGLLCEPLAAQADTLGLLHVHVRRRVPGKARATQLAERQHLVRMLGEHVSLTLVNIQLRETLREQSWRDSLTGLFNRRYMEETLRREIRRAEREGYQLGLLLADLDNFKQLNDAFGHAAGDEELRRIGRLLSSAVRAEDVACRFGGEEFVVILPKASVEDTHRRAEALRAAVKPDQAGVSTSLYPTTTMSVGVAAYPDHGTTAEELIMGADSAMYRAKAGGRDQVVVATRFDGQGVEVSTS